jgi:hypothetical protein
MFTSTTITKIAPALLKAQSLMGAALKGSKNPYFKSNYADLGAVLEACKEHLNSNGITILQPIGKNEHGTYVETVLLHESGEFITSITPVIFSKENDPQAQGSAITYGRRYGLQSFISLPAEDDDGEKAMTRKPKAETYKVLTKIEASHINNPGGDPTVTQKLDVPTTLTSETKTEALSKPRTSFRKPKPEETAKSEALSNGVAKNEVLSNGNAASVNDDLGLN